MLMGYSITCRIEQNSHNYHVVNGCALDASQDRYLAQ
jgi:hypothetical protein